MTTNNTSLIFKYPLTLEKEYLWLMETRTDFLKKLTTAERYKLTISYEHLGDVWMENRTEQQNAQYEQLSEQLNLLLSELENDAPDLKNSMETSLKTHIAESLTKLSIEESNFEQEEQDLIEVSNTWKKHIDQLKATLNERKDYLKQTSDNKRSHLAAQEKHLSNFRTNLNESTNAYEIEWMSNLEENSNQLEASKNEWNELLQLQEQLSNEYALILEAHQQTLLESSLVNETIMNELSAQKKKLLPILKKHEMEDKIALREHELTLQRSLKSYEDELLLPLKNEMLTDQQTFPKDLKHLVMQEEWHWLSKMPKLITEESEQRKNSLEQLLFKLGYRNIGLDNLIEEANKNRK